MTNILAIDQGTTSSRAILFDENLTPMRTGQMEFEQIFPKPGWVEHNPAEILETTWKVCREAIGSDAVAGIGITNQRETTVIWNRETGEAIHNAIVWQDRRTAEYCDSIRGDWEARIAETTGLVLDPYFSATKVKWLLDNVDGARADAKAGKLLFGTIDSFLIWHLTGGSVHATDATNAARTMLYDIRKGQWDAELLNLFGIPAGMLPEVKDSAADFGTTEMFGATMPIAGVAGDQQAATVGQACFEPGMLKSTYGTGCFALFNTGDEFVASKNKLLTTIAYQIDGKPTYALEGAIFIAGAVVQWLRDGLKMIEAAPEVNTLAEQANPDEDVYFVPAFTGLGAPYWRADARGAIFGLTRGTGPNEIAKAAIESVAYQTRDLLEAMKADMGDISDTKLRVDGGMVVSDLVMQTLADILGTTVDRPEVTETTAKGAAYLAGLHLGLQPKPSDYAKSWALEKQFSPNIKNDERERKYTGWQKSVQYLLN